MSNFDVQFGNPALIAGVDEAGRGPLAGPVVAAAVILDPEYHIAGIADSKKLSEKKRLCLFDEILSRSLATGIGMCTSAEIDTINILQASLLAMKRAIVKLRNPWEVLLIDGNRKIPDFYSDKQHTLIGGDNKSPSIGAASIIAKTVRDKIMIKYDQKWPEYKFAQHKGYPTKLHRELIQTHGPVRIHRKSFCGNSIQSRQLRFL
ncbi:MAG: ribonuclease HII [Fibrobacterota bacterium]